MTGFEVTAIEPMTLCRVNRLTDMYVLSPFVWKEGDIFHLLLRAVPRRDDEPRLKMAEIWHGVSADGCHFDMDIAPVIFPGPALVDLDGCEDPTILRHEGQLRVWYTGWNQQQATGRLLLARGPDVARLGKVGIALDSRPPFTNPKEATIVGIPDGSWRLYFEFARDGASLIGQADAEHPDGPWTTVADSPLQPRPEAWDAWHLSAGPVIGEGGDRPVMFYNGATQDAHWRIGWAAFDRDMTKLIGRSAGPLIVPSELNGVATDIAFAASAVQTEDGAFLYFSQSDQDLKRATLRRT